MSPYKRHAPATEGEMDKRMKGPHTLCNILRDMYHMTENPTIRLKCRLAFSMGKAMCNKLVEYKGKFGFQESEFRDGI